MFATNAKGGLPYSILGSALILSGPFLALYAVLGASGQARKKVLLPAIAGAVLTLLLLCAAAAAVWGWSKTQRFPEEAAPASSDG